MEIFTKIANKDKCIFLKSNRLTTVTYMYVWSDEINNSQTSNITGMECRVLARSWRQGVQIGYSLKNRVSTYNTFACVLQIKQGVHLANWASKRHPKVLLANTIGVPFF